MTHPLARTPEEYEAERGCAACDNSPGGPCADHRPDPKPVTLKARPSDVTEWERCAREMGLSRQAWCMLVLNVAAGVAPITSLRRVSEFRYF